MDIYEILEARKVPFERFDHPAAVTCEEADKVIPFFEGAARTKNLFLRDAKGKRRFLVTLRTDRHVDFKELSDKLDATRMGFASEERLEAHLGIAPGCLSLLAILKDAEGKVELAVDKDVWSSQKILCHPWVNTTTLIIPTEHVRRMFSEMERKAAILDFGL